jgi:signal peptidase II
MVSAPEQRRFLGVVLVVLLFDLVSKFVAEALLPRFVGVNILGEFFQLRLVYNPGAAFGIGVGEYSRWVFMGLSVAALVVLGSMLRATRSGDWLRLHSLSLIFAGAAGNLIDRVRSPRGVVDFLDFTFGSYHFPTFNVADMGVSCGAFLLAVSLWMEGRQQPAAESAPPAAP